MWLLTVPVFLAIGWYSPWWMLVVFGIAAGFFCKKSSAAAGAGFLVGGISWGLVISVLEFQSGGLVSQRLGGLFGVTNSYLFAGLVIAGAGSLGAISGFLGQWIRRLTAVSS